MVAWKGGRVEVESGFAKMEQLTCLSSFFGKKFDIPGLAGSLI
jgi:hypothetical protein